MFENFPYVNFHDLNLDWIIQKVKEAYSPDNPPDNLVLSVNGETGDVVLYQSENIVFPDVDSNQWRMVRSADGHTTGVLFNENYMYVMYDNTADRVYTMNHPQPILPDAANRLPDVTEDYTNIRRQIRTSGTDNIVGIELKQNKAYRMKDVNRYEIYDSGNPPPYPVTSVNGSTGAVVLAIPFTDITVDDVMFVNAVTGHEWGIGRETADGTATIQIVTDSTKAEAYIDFFDENSQVTYTKKLLTTDDIPSSSGVVSVNGSTGVVTLYGTNIAVSSSDSTKIDAALAALDAKTGADIAVSGSDSTKIDAALSSMATAVNSNAASIDGIEDAIAIVANNNTHGAISSGQFVYVKNHGTLTEGLYKASTNIAANAALSSSNLVADSDGGLNALTSDIATLNSKIEPQQTSDCNSATETGRYLTINTTTNAPASGHFVLDVIKYSNSEIVQFAQETFGYGRFVRQYYQGTWSAWQGLALKDGTASSFGTTWGRSVTAYCKYNVATIYVNQDIKIQVWLAGTSDISISVITAGSSSVSSILKAGTGSISFSSTSASGTDYTITRDGKNITISTTTDRTFLIIT